MASETLLAPSQDLTIALNRLQWGAPLTPKQEKLIADRQWSEAQAVKRGSAIEGIGGVVLNNPNMSIGDKMLQGGGGGNIDVNSYSGSMYARPGTGMEPAPILGGNRMQPYNPNVSADIILGQRFGQRQAGQVSYAPATPAAPAGPQTFTQGQQTPRGSILGMGESVTIGQPIAMAQPTRMAPQAPSAPILGQSYQGVPDMTGGYEAMAPRPVSQPSMAAPAPVSRPQAQPQPIQPSILGGSTMAMPQQVPAMAPLLGNYQTRQQPFQGSVDLAVAGSPNMRQLGMQQQQFAATQQERQTKELVNRAASEYAAGNTGIISQLPAYLQAEVKFLGTKMAQDIAVKPEKPAIQEQALQIARNLILSTKAPGSKLTPTEEQQAMNSVLGATKSSPEEQARTVGLVEEAKSDATFINDIQSNALESSDTMDQNKEVKRLLTSGLTTGTGEQFKTNALALLKSVGINFDSSRIGDKQYLISLLGQDALTQARKFYAKQGSVTESERKRIDTIALSMDKDPNAVLQMIAMRDALAQRAIDANKYVSSLKESNPNISKSELANAARNWYSENRLSKFLGAAQGAQAGGAGQEIRTDKMGNRWILGPNGKPVKAP